VDLLVKQALHWMGSGIRTRDGSERGCWHFMYFSLSVFIWLKVLCAISCLSGMTKRLARVVAFAVGGVRSPVCFGVSKAYTPCGGSGSVEVVVRIWPTSTGFRCIGAILASRAGLLLRGCGSVSERARRQCWRGGCYQDWEGLYQCRLQWQWPC
jgi:hypothetical protein